MPKINSTTIFRNTVTAIALATPGAVFAQQAPEPQVADAAQTIVVTGRYVPRETRTDTALKTPMALKDVPISVAVLTDEFLRDIGARNLLDAVGYVSSTTVSNGFNGVYSTFSIRGQQLDQVNGYRLDGAPFLNFTTPDFSAIESIEVLRGPVSTLYGRGNGGGVINLISKKPLEDFRVSVGAEAGSFKFMRVEADVNVPLSDKLAVRVTAAASDGNSQVDVARNSVRSVFGALQFRPTEQTTLLIQGQYQETFGITDAGLPVYNDVDGAPWTLPDNLPRNTFLGANWNNYSIKYRFLTAVLTHEFSDRTTVNVRGSYTGAKRILIQALGGSRINPVTNLVTLEAENNSNDSRNYSFEGNILQKIDIGSVKSTLLVGVDHSDFRVEFADTDYPVLGVVDIRNPRSDFAFPGFTTFTTFTDPRVATGVYAQVNADLTDRLTLLAGLRYDWYKSSFIDNTTGEDFTPFSTSDLSHRAGLTYDLTDELSIYGGYSVGFNPSGTLGEDGKALKPETATNYEIGIKSTFLDGRLNINAAAFQTNRRDLPINIDPDGNGVIIVASAGKETYKGLEIDISASPKPGWDLVASGTLLDAKNKDGRVPRGVYDYAFSFFSSYALQSGPLKNFGVAGGVRVVSERPAVASGSFTLKPYAVADGQIFYRKDNMQLRLLVSNLFDKKYIESAAFGTFNGVRFAPKRNVRLTASYTF